MMKKLKVHFGSAGIEKVIPFKYRGKQFYMEIHCFCGLMVSDKNRMGVFVDHPAWKFAAKMLDKNPELAKRDTKFLESDKQK